MRAFTKLMLLVVLAIATRAACPAPIWIAWGSLQALALVVVGAPIWIAAAARDGARRAVAAAGTTWLLLASALTFESLPDRSHYGVAVTSAAALLFALVAMSCCSRTAFDTSARPWALDRRVRRATLIVSAILVGFFGVCFALFRFGAILFLGGLPQGDVAETLIFNS